MASPIQRLGVLGKLGVTAFDLELRIRQRVAFLSRRALRRCRDEFEAKARLESSQRRMST